MVKLSSYAKVWLRKRDRKEHEILTQHTYKNPNNKKCQRTIQEQRIVIYWCVSIAHTHQYSNERLNFHTKQQAKKEEQKKLNNNKHKVYIVLKSTHKAAHEQIQKDRTKKKKRSTARENKNPTNMADQLFNWKKYLFRFVFLWWSS